MENLGYYNGEIKILDELKIPALDRSIYFGDGVYEVVYCVNQNPFGLKDHIKRFYDSCSLLKINFKMKKEKLERIIKDMAKKQGGKYQSVYWQASRASAIREHIFPQNKSANLLIMVTENKIKDMNKLRYDLITEEDTRFFHCNIKTLNLIPSVLASEKAKEKNCNEAVLHRGEMVTECAHSNVSIIKDGVFRTAPLSNLILPGVTRAHIIKFCKDLKIPVLEKHFTIKDLFDADEVIVSASGCLCMGVNTIDGEKVGGKAPRILKALQNAYEQEFINQCGSSFV